MKGYKGAAWRHDNMMPPEDDYPDPPEEMDCPECGATVDLQELTGTCPECCCECEFDLDDF